MISKKNCVDVKLTLMNGEVRITSSEPYNVCLSKQPIASRLIAIKYEPATKDEKAIITIS